PSWHQTGADAPAHAQWAPIDDTGGREVLGRRAPRPIAPDSRSIREASILYVCFIGSGADWLQHFTADARSVRHSLHMRHAFGNDFRQLNHRLAQRRVFHDIALHAIALLLELLAQSS